MEEMTPGKLYKYYYIGQLKTKWNNNNICLFLKREGLFDKVLIENKIHNISHLECLITEVQT